MDVGGGGGAPDPAPAPAQSAGAPGGGGAGGRINIVSGGQDDEEDDSDSEQQAFYAGGSTNSGNMILGPKKKKVTNVGDFFKAFKEAGAEEVDPSETGEGSSRGPAFSGGGFRLGSDETPSAMIGGPSTSASKEDQPRRFVLKMWRDGFSIDDGDIRQYNDPQHREEEFVKPKVSARPFQGAGNVLGSIAPSVAPPEASSSLDPGAAEKAAQQIVNFSEASPVANIQVRLADGSRLIVKLNHSHTVGDLRTYINTARPQYSGVTYSLLTTFPNKELTEDSATVSSAGLVGAAVLQRLK